MIKLSESNIKRQVQDFLNARGLFWFRQNTGAFKTKTGGFYHFGAIGSPDIFILHKGLLIGLEIKSPKGKQEPAQKLFGEKMEKNGGLYFIIRSFGDILQVEKILL